MKTSVNERIKIFIESKNIAQNEFAARTGLSETAISKMVNGETSPFGSTMKKITAAYPSLNEDWLRTGNGEMTQAQLKEINETITKDMYVQLKKDLEMYRAMCAKLMGIEVPEAANFKLGSLKAIGSKIIALYPTPSIQTVLDFERGQLGLFPSMNAAHVKSA